nr:hypothetical protein [Tanacetum cinerariifolium]
SQQAITRNKGKAIVNYSSLIYDQEPDMVAEKEINKLMAIISLLFNKINKPTTTTSKLHQTPIKQIRTTLQEQTEELGIWTCSKGMSETKTGKGFSLSEREDAIVQPDNDEYNVFAIDRQHPEQPESVNDTFLNEQGDPNITIDSLDMSINGEEADQDDDDLARERDLLAYLIEKLKCEIDDNKNRNKLLESSNKTLVDKLKSEITISKKQTLN